VQALSIIELNIFNNMRNSINIIVKQTEFFNGIGGGFTFKSKIKT